MVDLYTHELYKQDRKIKLQAKPFQVLQMLLQRAGELETRTELREVLWSRDTFVDFEQNLKTAVWRVRTALGDSADCPRYIETVASLGYRFIAPVQWLSRSPAAIGLARKTRLAVLPFDYPHGDADLDESFSDGMIDATISLLGSLCPRQLGVIARTSVMQYKHTEKTIAQIGQELDVDYVLEGGIRRAGTRVEISVRLIQASDQTLVWAGSYDRELANDALAIQHSVALSISRSSDISGLSVGQPSAEAAAESLCEPSVEVEKEQGVRLESLKTTTLHCTGPATVVQVGNNLELSAKASSARLLEYGNVK